MILDSLSIVISMDLGEAGRDIFIHLMHVALGVALWRLQNEAGEQGRVVNRNYILIYALRVWNAEDKNFPFSDPSFIYRLLLWKN
jgi:hypothetical protein